MHEEYVAQGEEEFEYVSGACHGLADDDQEARDVRIIGDETSPYTIEHAQQGNAMRVTVLAPENRRVLDSHLYTHEFLVSEDVEKRTVDLGEGNTLKMKYWGGSSCVEPRSPD
jgi:hypothetical protein